VVGQLQLFELCAGRAKHQCGGGLCWQVGRRRMCGVVCAKFARVLPMRMRQERTFSIGVLGTIPGHLPVAPPAGSPPPSRTGRRAHCCWRPACRGCCASRSPTWCPSPPGPCTLWSPTRPRAAPCWTCHAGSGPTWSTLAATPAAAATLVTSAAAPWTGLRWWGSRHGGPAPPRMGLCAACQHWTACLPPQLLALAPALAGSGVLGGPTRQRKLLVGGCRPPFQRLCLQRPRHGV
jgi:hypothetical protein